MSENWTGCFCKFCLLQIRQSWENVSESVKVAANSGGEEFHRPWSVNETFPRQIFDHFRSKSSNIALVTSPLLKAVRPQQRCPMFQN